MRSLAVVLAVALSPVSLPPRAVAEVARPCSFVVKLTFSPGLSVTPAEQRFTSNGETGTIECNVGVAGRDRSLGSLGVEGVLRGPLGGATCAYESGFGRMVLRIPTGGGILVRDERFAVKRVGVADRIKSRSFSGVAAGLPTRGDCVTTALTEATLIGRAILR